MVNASSKRDRVQASTRHPRGLLVLSFTEIWERFSFYGMQALLMLYMVGALLPSHPVDRVWGFAGFRTSLEAVFGSLDDQALAAQILGLYAGLVYLTPILGGWIGDRWLGTRRTVLIGAGLMATGHLLLAFDASFLIALLLLVIGSGCLKGNIATQVGRLYAPDDSRRDRAFLWYAFAINIGAFAGPLVCGALGEKIGWHWGFATAAIGMLIGIAIYAGGARHLPPDRLRGQAVERTAPLDATERRRVGALLVAIVLLLGYNIPFGQEYVIVPLWLQGHLNRHMLGFEIPVSWYVAADGFVSVAATPFVLGLWRWQASREREPSEIGKIAIGTTMMAAADLLLAVLSAISPDPHSIFFAWGFVYFLLASTAYLFTMPILLALVSRAAPPKLAATLMGVAYAGLFVANVTIGWMGRFYSPDHPVGFWLSQAGIAAVGVGAALLLRRPLTRILLRDQLPEVASA